MLLKVKKLLKTQLVSGRFKPFINSVGLDPWHVGDFGPFECKSKDDLRTVAIQGKIIRGEVYNRNKRGAENEKQMAISKRLKITHLPSTEIKNSPNIDRQLTCKYPSYSAGLSLKHGYFTWFSEK